jgi:hypothetical protein
MLAAAHALREAMVVAHSRRFTTQQEEVQAPSQVLATHARAI